MNIWRAIVVWIVRHVWLAVSVAALLLVGAFVVRKAVTGSHLAVTHSDNIELTPAVVSSIRDIGQWEFLEVSDEELVDTVRHRLFGDDELARVYYGTLRLGIDLGQAPDGWLHLVGDTVVAELPPVVLLDSAFLDEARAKPFYESGQWSETDRADLARRAADKMRKRCLSTSNINSARTNARRQVAAMLYALGFKHVRVTFNHTQHSS